MNEYTRMAVNFLKNVYQEDFVAVAQIITAEADENNNILIEYLDCVEDFIKKLKEKLSSNDDLA